MPRERKLPAGMRQRGGQYHADFMVHGRRVRQALASDFAVAKQLLAEIRARAERADFGMLDNDVQLDGLREQYLAYCRQSRKPGTVERYEYALSRLLPRLSARSVRQLSVAIILTYRANRLAENVSPRTVNYEVMILGAMLNWAAKHDVIASNPISGIERLPEDEPQEGRPLDASEANMLLDAAGEPWRDIWYAYLTTGMRKMELASLTFDDIDFDNRELIVRQGVAKNGRVHVRDCIGQAAILG